VYSAVSVLVSEVSLLRRDIVVCDGIMNVGWRKTLKLDLIKRRKRSAFLKTTGKIVTDEFRSGRCMI